MAAKVGGRKGTLVHDRPKPVEVLYVCDICGKELSFEESWVSSKAIEAKAFGATLTLEARCGECYEKRGDENDS